MGRLVGIAWLVGLLGMAGGVSDSRAQGRYEEIALRHGQVARAYAEAFALPGASSPVLVVAIRVPNSRLVFMRSQSGAGADRFVAHPEVVVTVYREETPVAERTWRAVHEVATFEETQRRDLDLEGTVQVALPPGRYTYQVRFEDENAKGSARSARRAATLPAFEGLDVAPPFLGRALGADAEGVYAEPINLGGDLAFGEAGLALVPVTRPGAAQAATLRYVLRRLDPDAVDQAVGVTAQWARRSPRAPAAARPSPEALAQLPGDTVRVGFVAVEAGVPVPGADSLTWERGRLRWEEGPPVATLVALDLGAAALPDGTYELSVTLEAESTQVSTRGVFQTYWRGMPLALYDATVAIRQLRFLEDRKTVRALLRGSRADREAQLRAYWAERDPTPGTAFNELMAEYYRRIDHAATAFRSGVVPYPDGLETDQARIYVVYGPPRETVRTYPPDGGVEETWTYADGRRFVFHAPTSLDPFVLQNGSR